MACLRRSSVPIGKFSPGTSNAVATLAREGLEPTLAIRKERTPYKMLRQKKKEVNLDFTRGGAYRTDCSGNCHAP